MSINISGKHIEVGDALRNHIQSNLEAVTQRYFGDPIEAHIVVEKHSHKFSIDLAVHLSKHLIVRSHGEDDDAYRAFDLASQKMENRIKRYKSRLRDRKRSNSDDDLIQAQQYTISSEHEDQGHDTPLVIAEMDSHVPSLSVSEAVMVMDLTEQPVVMFKNIKHGEFNVVYRRPDGHIGWIDPKIKS